MWGSGEAAAAGKQEEGRRRRDRVEEDVDGE
jgi:hypothetical protein